MRWCLPNHKIVESHPPRLCCRLPRRLLWLHPSQQMPICLAFCSLPEQQAAAEKMTRECNRQFAGHLSRLHSKFAELGRHQRSTRPIRGCKRQIRWQCSSMTVIECAHHKLDMFSLKHLGQLADPVAPFHSYLSRHGWSATNSDLPSCCFRIRIEAGLPNSLEG